MGYQVADLGGGATSENCTYLHKHMDNCSRKWQKAKAEEAPLLLMVLKAMFLKTVKLLGDQRPQVSTTNGIKIPPAA